MGIDTSDGQASPRPLTADQVGMVAALPQLHHGVDEVGHVVLVGPLAQEGKVLLQDGSVVLLLDIGQLYFDDCLLLGSEVLSTSSFSRRSIIGLRIDCSFFTWPGKRDLFTCPDPHSVMVTGVIPTFATVS